MRDFRGAQLLSRNFATLFAHRNMQIRGSRCRLAVSNYNDLWLWWDAPESSDFDTRDKEVEAGLMTYISSAAYSTYSNIGAARFGLR